AARRPHPHHQLWPLGPVDQARQRGGVSGEQRRAEQGRERAGPPPAPRHDSSTSTVTSSHETTHSVLATTLPVIARVTASASALRAPPRATTSLARPQA